MSAGVCAETPAQWPHVQAGVTAVQGGARHPAWAGQGQEPMAQCGCSQWSSATGVYCMKRVYACWWDDCVCVEGMGVGGVKWYVYILVFVQKSRQCNFWISLLALWGLDFIFLNAFSLNPSAFQFTLTITNIWGWGMGIFLAAPFDQKMIIKTLWLAILNGWKFDQVLHFLSYTLAVLLIFVLKFCTKKHGNDRHCVSLLHFKWSHFSFLAVLQNDGDELLHSSVWCVTSPRLPGISCLGSSSGPANRATQVFRHPSPA